MKTFITVSLLFFCSLVNAADYYVSKSGNDVTGNGSIGSPWLTIFKATSTVSSFGNVINIGAGTYLETSQLVISPGVSLLGVVNDSTAVRIQSTLSAQYSAMISMTSATQGTNGQQSIKWLTLDGRNVTSWILVCNGRSNVEIAHCQVFNAVERGILINAWNNLSNNNEPATYSTGNSVHHNWFKNNSSHPGFGTGELNIGGQQDMTIYSNKMESLRASGINGWPIKYLNNGWYKNVEIYNNTLNKTPVAYSNQTGSGLDWYFCIELARCRGVNIHHNQLSGGGVDNNIGYLPAPYAYSIRVCDNVITQSVPNLFRNSAITIEYKHYNVIIERNYVENFAVGVMFTPRGTTEQGDVGGYQDSIWIRNNLFVLAKGENDARGVDFYSDANTTAYIYNSTNVWIDNNTMLCKSGYAGSYGIRLTESNAGGLLNKIYIRNNVISNFQTTPIVHNANPGARITNLYVQNNDMYGNGNNNTPWFIGPVPNPYTNSGNITGTPTYGSNYTIPNSSSILYNAGIDVGIPFNNGAPDIGYHEFGGSTNPGASIYRSRISGSWFTVSAGNETWEKSTDGGTNWSNAAVAPNSTDGTIVIREGHTITLLTASVSVDQLTIDATGRLDISSGSTLTIDDGTGDDIILNGILSNAGTFTQNGGAAVVLNSGSEYIHATNTGIIPTGTYHANSTINVTGVTTTLPTFSASATYGNVIWNCPVGTSSLSLAGNLKNIAGNFTFIASGTTGELRLLGTTSGITISINGNLNIQGGKLVFSNGSASTSRISLGGSFNQTGGIFDGASSGSMTIEFTGVNKSFIQSAGTLTNTQINWTVNSGASLNLVSNLPVAASRSLNVIGTLTRTTGSITGTGTTYYSGPATIPANLFASNIVAGTLVVNRAGGVSLGSALTTSGPLTLTAGALSIGSNTLTVNGAVSGPGTLSGTSGSNLSIGGIAGTLNFTGGSNTLKNILLNTGSTATLGNALNITGGTAPATEGTVIVNTGAILTTGGNLTIKSNAFGTARVATSLGTIIGNATVERYINANVVGRKWHLLSGRSTMSSQNILQSWQEGGGAPVYPNQGTWLTSNLYSGSNGFDETSQTSSILKHNPSVPSWVGQTATNTGSVSDEQGYMLYIRGDRFANSGNALQAQTVLRTTGTLRQGTQAAVTILNGNTGFTMVGNPYASPVDLENVLTAANMGQFFYIWDASEAGNHGLGMFRLVQKTGGGTYISTPTTGSDNTLRYIHSGQALFLKTNGVGNAAFVVTEANKASSLSIINPLAPVPGDQQLYTELVTVNSGNTELVADAVRVWYNPGFSAGATDDVLKMGNFKENISSYRNGIKLIAEMRPMITVNDTVFLRSGNLEIKNYRFKINTFDFVQTNLIAMLEDSWLNNSTPLNLGGAVTDIDFSVTADPASANSDRFRIVFAAAGPLPVTITSFEAAQQGSQVAVEWKATNQVNMKQYEVEKSTDGINYIKVNTQAAVGTNGSDATYTWMDVNPVTGSNFYRLRSVSVNGDIKISQVVLVKIAKGNPVIRVYPNPVVNRTMGLQFTDMQPGVYLLRLFNTAGQLLFTKTVNHSGGSATQTIVLDSKITNGNYLLEILKPDKLKTTTRVLITE